VTLTFTLWPWTFIDYQLSPHQTLCTNSSEIRQSVADLMQLKCLQSGRHQPSWIWSTVDYHNLRAPEIDHILTNHISAQLANTQLSYWCPNSHFPARFFGRGVILKSPVGEQLMSNFTRRERWTNGIINAPITLQTRCQWRYVDRDDGWVKWRSELYQSSQGSNRWCTFDGAPLSQMWD